MIMIIGFWSQRLSQGIISWSSYRLESLTGTGIKVKPNFLNMGASIRSSYLEVGSLGLVRLYRVYEGWRLLAWQREEWSVSQAGWQDAHG
jgi:hypothetical protein